MATDNPDLGSSVFNARIKFNNPFGRGLVISKEPHQKVHTTIPTDDTFEAVSDPLPLEFDRGERTTTQDKHDPGKLDSNPGGSGGKVVVEALPPRDLTELGAEVPWLAVNTPSTKVSNISL